MNPVTADFGNDEGGIRRVVEAYEEYLPMHGWEVVPHTSDNYDITAVHAGTFSRDLDVLHCHGLYFSADYDSASWEWSANAQVIAGSRKARIVTVPSGWISQLYERDMRLAPVIIPHGIDWWKYEPKYSGKYVLWNKGRSADVCDPTPVGVLASRCPDTHFVSTFSNTQLKNLRVTGPMPHAEMMEWLRNCSVYLATVKETWSIGIAEAMALGKPVLGFAHGNILNLVQHKVNGYLVEPGNYEELEVGLRYCVNNAQTLGENSRYLVQRFTWEKATAIVADVYNQCLRMKEDTRPLKIDPRSYER